ncbi:hypothetical protein D3C85_1379200 [compost metagenome]
MFVAIEERFGLDKVGAGQRLALRHHHEVHSVTVCQASHHVGAIVDGGKQNAEFLRIERRDHQPIKTAILAWNHARDGE